MTRIHRLQPRAAAPAAPHHGGPETDATQAIPGGGRPLPPLGDAPEVVPGAAATPPSSGGQANPHFDEARRSGHAAPVADRLVMRAARSRPAWAWLVPLLGLVLAPGLAAAHDTWFTVAGPTPSGERSLALGTGNQFPAYEVPVALEQLKASGCRGDAVKDAPLRRLAEREHVLVLRTARAVPATAALTCWAQLVPIDIQIDDKIVDLYLDEINAQPALRAHWAQLKARGVRWTERYEKHARVEIDGEGAPAEAAPVHGLGLDARLLAPQRPVRAGDTVRLQVLKDGQPLAGLPVELRSDLSPLGLWRVTDAQGLVQFTVPLAARWLLRGTEVLPSARHPEHFDSRFITLAFEARPRR